jgi:hypothetical protein
MSNADRLASDLMLLLCWSKCRSMGQRHPLLWQPDVDSWALRKQRALAFPAWFGSGFTVGVFSVQKSAQQSTAWPSRLHLWLQQTDAHLLGVCWVPSIFVAALISPSSSTGAASGCHCLLQR